MVGADPGEEALDGSLHVLPFSHQDLSTYAASTYADLADRDEVDDILVLKRFPTSLSDLQDAFADASSTARRPEVYGLAAHGRRVLEHLPDGYTILDPGEQRVLLRAFIEKYDWETSFLQRAATREAFVPDVARFISEATWQGSDINTDDAVLAELAACKRAFHQWLGTAGLLDPANVLPTAADELQNPTHREQIQREFDAVLVLEFEEFTPIDRRYLAALTVDTTLHCIAEEHSAIQRTWNEPHTIAHYTPGLTQTTPEDSAGEATGPAMAAEFLATGNYPDTNAASDGSTLDAVAVIEATDFNDQIKSVADEIERLRRENNRQYDEIAVVLRDSTAPIPETLRLLQNNGIPVSSATVGGLEHDPAARELYALISWCTHHSPPSNGEDPPGWASERATAVLSARVPTVTVDALMQIHDIGVDDGLAAAIAEWIRETDLKARIADSRPAVEARTQFDHIEDLLSLAEFLDENTLLDADWTQFCTAVEEEVRRASSDRVTTDVELPDHGVVVDAARVVKNSSRDVVFLIDVIDEEYPAAPRFSALFPEPQLENLAEYPSFTTPTAGDVRDTFATAGELSKRPLQAYYAELSRRMLAIGARTATDRLYFTTYHEATGGTGQHHQPSRFLTALENAVGPLERIDHDGLYSHGSAVQYALTHVDDTLGAVRRAGVMGDPIELDAAADEFATVQAILEADPPDPLADAVRARLDFARGRVRRE